MKKLFIPIVLSATLVAINISNVLAVKTIETLPADTEFSDVYAGDTEILYLIEMGVIKGNPDKTVKPENYLNRAEALTVFARMFNLEPTYDPNCTFKDVPANIWYAPYVSSMCKTGLVKGYPDGTFRADNILNKAEAVTILVRGLKEIKKMNISLNPPYSNLPSDVPSNSWYSPYANYVIDKKFIRMSGDKFNGEQSYTRGDLFMNVYRSMRTIEKDAKEYSYSLDPIVASSNTVETFESDEAFDDYIAKIKSAQPKYKYEEGESSTMIDVADSPGAMKGAEGEAESITNIQEEGVDEGGIVKTHGDHLVVLRRGKLFTVEIGDNLQPIDQKNVYPDGLESHTWYDEMLIYNDMIIVVGYSYEVSATEIVLFGIDDNGHLTYKTTHFLASNDYYSSRNYASRLVGDELIFYMPYYIYWYDNNVELPWMRSWSGTEITESWEIIDKTDIYKPVSDVSSPTLHTLVRCNLSSGDLDCAATGILGPYSRTFYVSPNAIYLWISDPIWFYDELLYKPEGEQDRAFVYKVGLRDNLVQVAESRGQPIDQFSFKEDDSYLNVLVRENSWGDGMWNPEFTGGKLAFVRIPLNIFGSTPEFNYGSTYAPLPNIEGYNLVNRYVGDGYLLYGESGNWWNENPEFKVYAYSYIQNPSLNTIDLFHAVDRIERLGDDAVIVGSDGKNLMFSSIVLEDRPIKSDMYTVENVTQGELRSHGFFFKEYSDVYGILGLPIRIEGGFYSSYLDESSEILFLETNDIRGFSKLGSLKSNPVERDDNCEISCVDWYGNSRPIFYGGRIFALLGYELIEGEVVGNAISEKGRVNFLMQR